MTEKIYTCELLTDVVLNTSLATEGNIKTLNYIAGSNFLGIIANEIYKNNADKAYEILHSNKVLFGDAHISDGTEMTFAVPFTIFNAKENKKFEENKNWVLSALDEEKQKKMREAGIQFKQIRSGFLSESGKKHDKIEKNFALKSAQSRETRASADGKMFGMDALEKGLIFMFSIKYKNEEYIKIVEDYLCGEKSIGKSKTAQYGRVKIEKHKVEPKLQQANKQGFTAVYAESNLCFFNEFGHPTFQPSAEDLGFEKETEICWEKSQIRTYQYASWNFKRDTPNMLRSCIQKGSVFYIEGVERATQSKIIGEYQNEGLGRVIYNPVFLEADTETGAWNFIKEPDTDNQSNENKVPIKAPIEPNTPLGKFLKQQKENHEKASLLAKNVHAAVFDLSNENLKNISPSQWGEIRAKATNATKIAELESDLFGGSTKKGFLVEGVSAEKYWDKHKNRENFKAVFDKLKESGTVAIAKYAAEMAKESSTKKNKENG